MKKDAQKAWRERNPERVKEFKKEWRKNNPEKVKKHHSDYYQANTKKVVAKNLAWAKANPRKVLASQLKRLYGITLAFFDAMVLEQCGRCAICSRPMIGWKEPCVDHDHLTNDVRELLCSGCNKAIGFLEERPELFLKARDYLIRHKG
jgi:hypothetical protein